MAAGCLTVLGKMVKRVCLGLAIFEEHVYGFWRTAEPDHGLCVTLFSGFEDPGPALGYRLPWDRVSSGPTFPGFPAWDGRAE
jgi:hypothetical protein